jgi:hypothetical protein
MAGLNDSSTRGPSVAVVIAIAVLIVIAAAVFLLNPHKVADVTVTHVDYFAPHTEMDQMKGSIHVIGEQPETEDDLYIVASVKITDHLRLPLFLSAWTGGVTFANGSTADATTVPPRDMPRLGQTFPAFSALVTNPINYDDEVAPGATREGQVILLFPNTTQDQWKSKKSATVTIELRNQEAQTVPLP